jgi:hypothetical protein
MRFTDPTGLYLCTDKAACANFEDARQADLLDPASQPSAAAYGLPGIDNGVTVQFGDTGLTPGDTKGYIEANQEASAMVAKTIVTLAPSLKGVDLQAMVAHEGTHVLQWQKWAASWDLTKARPYDLSNNPRLFEAERDAYRVENAVYSHNQISGNIYGCKGCVLGVANKTIGDVDAAIRRILRETSGDYHLTPDSPQLLDTRWTTPPP